MNWTKHHNEQLVNFMQTGRANGEVKNAEWMVLMFFTLLPIVLKLALAVMFIIGLFRPETYTWRELILNCLIYGIFWSVAGDIPWLYTKIRFILHYSNKLTAPWWRQGE